MEIKSFIQQWLADNAAPFIALQQLVWDNPELSMQEYRCAAAVADLLSEQGFTVQRGVAGLPTAFVAEWGSGRPVLGFNCEYDALPGLSQSAASTERQPLLPGAPGQGCGHNLLAAGGVWAASALKAAMQHFQLPGSLRIFGAPGEELCLGKAFMGRAGLFKDLDAVLDWHPWSVSKCDPDDSSAYFSVKYHFRGQSCHGNAPWFGRSALDAAILTGHAIEMLREHLPPGCPPLAANTVNYTFSDTGAEFASVVPETATLWVVGRFTDTEDAAAAQQRVENCARGAALATGTGVEQEICSFTHHTLPNSRLARLMHDNLTLLGPPAFSEQEQQAAREIQLAMGGEALGLSTQLEPFADPSHGIVTDVSEYSWNAPYACAWLAMGPLGLGWHHWGVTRCAGSSIGQKTLHTAATLLALSMSDLLLDPAILAEARAEFEQRLAGRSYTCLLPEDLQPPLQLNRDVMDKYRVGSKE